MTSTVDYIKWQAKVVLISCFIFHLFENKEREIASRHRRLCDDMMG
jgi:hypothetical protein